MELRSVRKKYGETVVRLAETNKNIVSLEADLGKSTQSIMFEKAYPERFFELGIAEANMISFGAGMALCGKIPFMQSFAVFTTGRVYDQIRVSFCIPNLHGIILGGSTGLSDANDGSTHQSVEDIALMRVLPNMTVLCPADAYEAEKMIEAAVELDGPVYIRTCRSDMVDVLPQDGYEFGKMQPIKNDGDIAIFACGTMVAPALEAAEMLKEDGIEARVINVGMIKPLDTETLFKIAGEVKGIVTVEDHSVIGGMGSAICEALADTEHPRVKIMGVKDQFGCSAYTPDELYEHYGLTAKDIAATVKTF